jgi:hypothetical protein
MVARVALAIGIVAVALVIAWSLRRRRPDAPASASVRGYAAPLQLDRDDFDRPDAPWLVALFSSATCDTCAAVREKSAVLERGEVAVVDVEFTAARALHERYRIEAVPTLVIADGDGVVVRGFVGPVTATDLWAAMAEVRQPGSSPEPGLGR